MRRFGVRIPTGSRKKPGCTSNRAFLCPPSLSEGKAQTMPENCAAVPGFMLGHKTPQRGSLRNPCRVTQKPDCTSNRAFLLRRIGPSRQRQSAAISQCQRRWLPLQHLAHHHPDCRRPSLPVHAFMACNWLGEPSRLGRSFDGVRPSRALLMHVTCWICGLPQCLSGHPFAGVVGSCIGQGGRGSHRSALAVQHPTRESCWSD